MKITITTKLRGRKDVSDLTKAFLELYDSSNAMVISNDEAKLEVDLTSCNRKKAKSFFDEMLAMFYGEEVTTQEKEEKPVTTTAKPQEVSNKEKNSREINKQEADNHEEEGKTATTTDIRVVSPEEIKLIEGENYEQVLEKIAQSSSSYGEFLHSVEFDLQLSKLNRDKFWVLMDGAQVFEKPEAIKLSKILKAVESKGKQLNRNEANYLFTQIKARTGYSGSEFVRILLKYREKYGEESSKIAIRPAKLRIKCLPQDEKFEEELSLLDVNKPLEERVAYIFDIMGFQLGEYKQETYKYLREDLITLVSEAVQMKEINIQKALSGLKTKNKLVIRMVLSEQINNFAKKIATQPQNTIATCTFLRDLQSVILSNTELRDIK